MKQFEQDRKKWYKAVKKITKVRYKQPTFIYKGKKPDTASIILSNHEGTDAPMSLEIYADFPVRFWGASEMNSGLIRMYQYQSRVYFHQKKHWNLWAARAFCLIASPLTNMFYKGLQLISTYHDTRFLSTLRQSVEAVKKGENIVIFPERSDNGYQAELEDFYAGFAVLAELLWKQGIDVDIYTAYYKKAEKQYIFDAPIKYSVLKTMAPDKDGIAKILLANCNGLAHMQEPAALAK